MAYGNSIGVWTEAASFSQTGVAKPSFISRNEDHLPIREFDRAPRRSPFLQYCR
jgi:hypothetical protein